MPVSHEKRLFSLDSKARAAYNSLRRDFCADVDNGLITVNTALARLLKFQQITSGRVIGDEGVILEVGREKRTLLKELLEDLPKHEPVAVFALFKEDIKIIREVAAEVGRSHCELTGSQNDLEEWQDGGKNVIATNIRSGKEGVDLTRTMYAIYYSLGFSLGDFEQSLARPDRHGQKRSVTYYHLIGERTIDEQVYKGFEKKEKYIQSVINAVTNNEF